MAQQFDLAEAFRGPQRICFIQANWFPTSIIYHSTTDAEHYNYFRDYDPGIGRYLKSDPIGLNARTADTYGYVSQSPTAFSDAYGLCKVEVRCNALGPGSSFSHCFVVTTEPNGSQTYFRGGPTARGAGNISKAASNSGNGGGGGYGVIGTNSGGHKPGSIDWPTPDNPQTGQRTYHEDNKPCKCMNTNLDRTLQAISSANTNYNPLTENSNSVAAAGIRGLGFAPGHDPAWSPGWDFPLPGTSRGGQSCCAQ